MQWLCARVQAQQSVPGAEFNSFIGGKNCESNSRGAPDEFLDV